MSYQNPVYSHDFADPFILKFRGSYWAYSTGFQADGRVFGVMHSDDLVHWDDSGGAMDPLPGGYTCYWAPEVTHEDDGSFLMYYSVGNEENMVIRVARAAEPAGPFIDLGVQLTKESFAIDAHVFKDQDGNRYLFYATDFLQHTHIGTGTVVTKMRDALSLDGESVPVTRAKYDWQVYDPKRESKGGIRWHTVEGPFVLKRKGTYYEMFSGGNWQNITYGVSFATSDQVMNPNEWQQHADGQKVLPILRTHPGRIVGPGHNSVVRGPNNRDLYCIYHEWVRNERVLAIDRLDWRGPDMILLGPTSEPTPGPFFPRKAANDGPLTNTVDVHLASPSCLIEFSILLDDDDALEIGVSGSDANPLFHERFAVSDGITKGVWHLVRLEMDASFLKLHVGEELHDETAQLSGIAAALSIRPSGSPRISSLDITPGWEDLFDAQYPDALSVRGWRTDDPGSASIVENTLRLRSSGSKPAVLTKDLGISGDFELVVNLRLESGATVQIVVGELGIEMVQRPESVAVGIRKDREALADQSIYEPVGAYHQLRVLSLSGRAAIAIDHHELGTFSSSAGRELALRVTGDARFDMVRVTEIASA